MSFRLVTACSSTSRLGLPGQAFGDRPPLGLISHLFHVNVRRTCKTQNVQCDFPRQLSQEISSQQRLNLARKGERFVECEMGDQEV